MRRTILYTLGLAAVVILVFFYFKYENEETIGIINTSETNEIIEIEKPTVIEEKIKNDIIPIPNKLATTVEEAKDYLKEYSKKSDYAAFVLENLEKYPDGLIKLAANRPRSIEFVKNYLENKNNFDKFDSAPKETVELNRKFPLYILWDKRWGYKEYEEVFCVLGCGPTTAAMAINGYGGNVSPLQIMDEMVQNNYYIKNIGTSWEGIRKILDKYGVASKDLPTVEKKYKNHLDTGEAILINVAPSKFTNIGHYMLIVGYNEKGFLLNDSNSIEYSQKEISFDELSQIIRGAWTLNKK